MTESTITSEIDERDLKNAVESLNSASFKTRFIRTDCNAADPVWKAPNGQAIHEHVRDQMDAFKKDLGDLRSQPFQNGVFQRSHSGTMFNVAYNQLFQPFVPAGRNLLYGPDRDRQAVLGSALANLELRHKRNGSRALPGKRPLVSSHFSTTEVVGLL